MWKEILGVIFGAVVDEMIDGLMDGKIKSASKGKFENWNEFESWFESNKGKLDKKFVSNVEKLISEKDTLGEKLSCQPPVDIS